MNKKGIITTILVVQLIFLAIITMATIQSERETFAKNTQFKKIAAYRMTSLYTDVSGDISDLRQINSTDEAMDQYIDMVNSTVPMNYNLEINISDTSLSLYDKNLEIAKEGTI